MLTTNTFAGRIRPPLRILSVCWGDLYDVEYVQRLRAAVARQLTVPHTFECITDKQIPNVVCHKPWQDWPGFWQKIQLFKPGFVQSPAIYFDLDIVICGGLDWLEPYARGFGLAMCKDWGDRRRICGSWPGTLAGCVMAWNGDGSTDLIYNNFDPRTMQRLYGDQDWITEQMHLQATLIPEGPIVSYKRHCRPHGAPPAGASVVAFHGRPNPHEVKEPWVCNHWGA